jgi:hypothetical protein
MNSSDCRIQIYCSYFHDCHTWNVIKDGSRETLFYGTIDQLEEWLIDSQHTHQEVNYN